MITLELTNAEAGAVWAWLRQQYPPDWVGHPLDFGEPQQASSSLALATEKLYNTMRADGLATP